MIRRTSILVLASVVSLLATQPVPVRVQMFGESYAILRQMEARMHQPAQTKIVKTTGQPRSAVAIGLPELVQRAPQAITLPRNPRAPPLFSSQT